MKKMNKAASVFLASALLACLCCASPASANDERVLKLSILAPLTTIDPHGTGNLQDFMFHRQVFEGLYYQNENTGEFEPRIAESHTVSEDGKTYTFKIRQNAKFHNGDTVKVSDCVFSYERAMNKPATRPRLGNIEKVYGVDDSTFVVQLKVPDAAFLSGSTFAQIISEREVKEQGDKFGTILTLAGTGPYYLTSLVHDVEWTCNAFPEYYRGEAAIKKLAYKPITQASAGLIAFESGDLDWYIAPIANWDDLTSNPDYNTELVPANHISFISINPLKAPLNDENLRKAIAYCIDKEAMNIACFDGYAKVADFMIPAGNSAAPTEGMVFNYDPEKAKEYLAKSAYPKGVNVGAINCAPGGYYDKMAQVLQENMAAVGITVTINRIDSATNLNNCRKQMFDITTNGYAGSGDSDEWRRFSYTKAVGSYYVKYDGTNYDWKHMDELWEKGVATTNVEERRAIYRELNDWITNTACMFPIFYKVQPYVWVKDLVIPANYPNYPQVYEWSWKK